jgi:hypothetical protein
MDKAVPNSPIRTYFNFPFRAPGWFNRFLPGAAFIFAGFFFPILPLFFVAGYAAEIMRRVAGGQEPEMPEWEDWGRLFLDGFRIFVLQFVYLLPAMIVAFGAWLLYLAGFIAMAALNGQQGAATGVFMFLLFSIFMLSIPVSTLLFVLGAVPLPVAVVNMLVGGRFSAGFQLCKFVRMLRSNAWGFFIAWVAVAGLALFIYMAFMMIYTTLILCCLLPFVVAPLGFYLSTVGAALFADAYRAGLPAAEEPAPAAPEEVV